MKKNRSILITGGALRIGKSIALALAKEGYDVIVHYNNSKDEAIKLKSIIQKYKVKCWILHANLLDKDSHDKLIDAAFSATNRLFALINNASIFFKNTLKMTPINTIEETFLINCFAPIMMAKRFSEKLQENGTIINLLDCRINTAEFTSFAYTLSKKTLYEATRMMALEFAPKIRVNAIAPGPVMLPDFKKSGVREKAGYIPLGKKPGVSDINRAILFLLASTSITGQTLFVDGGKHLFAFNNYEK